MYKFCLFACFYSTNIISLQITQVNLTATRYVTMTMNGDIILLFLAGQKVNHKEQKIEHFWKL